MVHADEYDNYNEIAIEYGCDGERDMIDWCNKRDLRKERKTCRAAGLITSQTPTSLRASMP